MSIQKDMHIKWQKTHITREDKEKLLNQKGALLWFTGLPASGKSTIANSLEKELYKQDYLTIVMDGDNIRHGLNKNLGFSKEDRSENIRRIGEVAKLFVETGVLTITAFISPYRTDRDNVRSMLKNSEFIEIYVKCPLSELERRDPKGFYKKAKEGLIKEFTGISAPYEAPLNPEIVLDTSKSSMEECVKTILYYLNRFKIVNKPAKLSDLKI
ncbi:MAG: adenylyl-sulfate kinase [Candidatus Firestonebacteria bacterium]|nr:adenylyl-sulfate kinase [Candidatus Firestonebacteria bacterium]